MSAKRVVFKVNRPSYQTKSNIVEKTFDKQKDIEMYFINNCVPNGLQVMNIITGYIGSIVEVEESKHILEEVKGDYNDLVKEYCETTKIPQANLGKDELNQLYAAAWLKAFHKANDIFDRIYRGRGNELELGAIVEDGQTPDGRDISIDKVKKKDRRKQKPGQDDKNQVNVEEEVYFDDIDSVEDESTEAEAAFVAGGASLVDAVNEG